MMTVWLIYDTDHANNLDEVVTAVFKGEEYANEQAVLEEFYRSRIIIPEDKSVEYGQQGKKRDRYRAERMEVE